MLLICWNHFTDLDDDDSSIKRTLNDINMFKIYINVDLDCHARR